MKFVCDVCGDEYKAYPSTRYRNKSREDGGKGTCGKKSCVRAVVGAPKQFVKVPVEMMRHVEALRNMSTTKEEA